MIEVSHLTKSYGVLAAPRDGSALPRAVDDLSFLVARGEVVGFLGPNGAGKSTTLRILAGFLGPTAGTVRIAGHDVVQAPLEARACVGYMPEHSPLYPEMRVGEYLHFRAELKRVPRKTRPAAVEKALADAHVAEVASIRIGHLSKGYRQRVALADALLGAPPLLILDEPTAGLDPNQIREVRALLRRLGREHTVLLSTHILSEVEAICSRALVISRGRLVAEGTIEALRAMRRTTGATVLLRGDPARALAAARACPSVARADLTDDPPAGLASLEVTFGSPHELGEKAAGEKNAGAKDEREIDAGAATEAIVAALVAAGIGVREVTPRGASLEQVFASLTLEPGEGAA
jgi:ABC-2 type transport system ATP-binding protein